MKNPQLVADIGGTNARFALRDPVTRRLEHVEILAAAEFPDIAMAIETYLVRVGAPRIGAACFAVACPAKADEIIFTNSPWHFSRLELARRFGFGELQTLNDFEALALAVPHLAASQLECVRAGEAEPSAPRAILGPGTGLGVSGLIPCGNGPYGPHWVALSGEGGHVSFAPTNDLEVELLRFLMRTRNRASVERVLCGEGLSNLFEFCAERAGSPAQRLLPAQITERALRERDRTARATLDLFCAVLGSVAGDLALTLGARGGLYIGGGIVPRILGVLRESAFVERFLAKGRMAKVLMPIPVYVILDPGAALHGAAAALPNVAD